MSSDEKLNILAAYPYLKDGNRLVQSLVAAKNRVRLLVDSGAFTAWKSGKPISLDDYCRFLESLPITPWRYFTLDVVGDPGATLSNYETMLKRGFNPVPIFTRGESPSVVDDYYKTSDLVGVGGLVGTERNKEYVRGIMDVIGKRPVHLLGFVQLGFIARYKPYSVDSSTWESGGRFGSAQVYCGGGRLSVLTRANLGKLWPRVRHRYAWAGINEADMRKPERWRGGDSIPRRLGAQTAVLMQRELRQRFGTRLFAALTTSLALDLCDESYRRLTDRVAL